jgi:hypothetical protein
MGEQGGGWQQWLHQLARNQAVLLMLGGALGTYLRYQVSKWFSVQPWTQGFPYGTLVIHALDEKAK